MESMMSLDELEAIELAAGQQTAQAAQAAPSPQPVQRQRPPAADAASATAVPDRAAEGPVALYPAGASGTSGGAGGGSAGCGGGSDGQQQPSPGADLDRRAVPLLFGANGAVGIGGSDVMSNWLGGMLGKAGSVSARPPVPAPVPIPAPVPAGRKVPPGPPPHPGLAAATAAAAAGRPKQPASAIKRDRAAATGAARSVVLATSGDQDVRVGSGRGKVLVLLDMNGTLLLRLKGKLGKVPVSFAHAGLNYFLR